MNNYKLSKYNLFVHESGNYLVYNTFRKTLIRTNKVIFNNLKQGNFKYFERKLLKSFIKNGTIILNEIDEFDEIRTEFNNLKNGSDFAIFTIYPTLKCNLQCTYCIQDTIKKNSLYIKNIPAVIQFVKGFVLQHYPKRIRIVWSGGEPLLKWNIIKEISSELLQFCVDHNVTYEAHIVTNGILVNYQIAKSFNKYKVKSAQITLDGPPFIHNMLRRSNTLNSDTFDDILQGINQSSSRIKTIVRININKKNTSWFEQLLQILSEKLKYKHNIIISPKMIVKGFSPCESNDIFSLKSFSKLEILYLSQIIKYGFECPKLLPSASGIKLRCAYYHDHSFNIAPDLKLYKCSELVGHTKYAFGEIANDGSFVQFGKKEPLISNFNTFEQKECIECNLLPMCMGKCIFSFINNNDPEDSCILSKYNINTKIRLFINKKRMEETENP